MTRPPDQQPDAEGDFLKVLNPDSLQIAKHARVEPALLTEAKAGQHYQFLRMGYFFVDPVESKPGGSLGVRVANAGMCGL